MRKFFALMLVVFISCNETLDLTSNTYFDVKQFLTSKNCETKCYQKADCEGVIVGLKGIPDDLNIMPETSTFYLNDIGSEKYSLEIKVDSLISPQVFDFLNKNTGKTIKVKGKIEGFDRPMNFKCERGFYLLLENEGDISLW